jgi:hypothetical protein
VTFAAQRRDQEKDEGKNKAKEKLVAFFMRLAS